MEDGGHGGGHQLLELDHGGGGYTGVLTMAKFIESPTSDLCTFLYGLCIS